MEDFFPLSIKLYHMWGDKIVRLGLKVSSSTVSTFYFEASEFQKMINDCYSDGGYDSHGYFIQVKKQYVRFSKEGEACTTHIRIDPEKWRSLIKDYWQKVERNAGPHFSCEIL